MTEFCQKCNSSDHSSCMIEHGGQRICRKCQVFDNTIPGVWHCECDCCEWDKNEVRKLVNSDGWQPKCPECKTAIVLVNPEEEFCKCKYDSLEEYESNYHWGLEVCQHCDNPYTPEKLAEISLHNNDPVNSPSHYQSDKFEVIEIIEAFSLGFNLGNAVKYILRARKKGNFTQDLEKAAWYLKRELEK